MNMNNIEVDMSEMNKGIFRATLKVPDPKKHKSSIVSLGPDPIPVEFSPSGLYRLKNVDISDGWDIEYVQVANIIIPAYRKSPPPMCTPAMRIVLLVTPFRFVGGHMVHAKESGNLVVTGDVFDYKAL